MKKIITPEHFENAWKLYEDEKINPLTPEEMFRGIIYTILSPGENYQKQMRVFNRLMDYGLNTPKGVLSNEKRLRGIVGTSQYCTRKIESIYKLSKNWNDSKIPELILEDVRTGRNNSFKLRKIIDKELFGMGYKTTSLFLRMCDYLDIAIIDMHVLRGLEGLVKGFEVTEEMLIRGISDKKYLEIEKLIVKLAEEVGVETAIMSMAIYHRDSHYRQGHQKEIIFPDLEFNIFKRKQRKVKTKKRKEVPIDTFSQLEFL